MISDMADLNPRVMRTMKWMCGGTKMGRIRNGGTTEVGEISKKVQERRLKWCRHVMRRDEEYVGERVMRMDVQRRRRKGRLKQRLMNSVNVDVRGKRHKTGLCGGNLSETSTPLAAVGKDTVEEELWLCNGDGKEF